MGTATTDGLRRVVRERITALDPSERHALAVIAAGAPLPQAPTVQAVGLDPLLTLEARQLARAVTLPAGPSIRLADQRYRDIVRHAPEVDWVLAASDAAAILRASGTTRARRHAAQVLVEADTPPPARELVTVARAANRAGAHAEVPALLAPVVDDPQTTPAVLADAHLLLGMALVGRSQPGAADQHLARAAALAPTPVLHRRAVARRASVLATHAGRTGDAIDVLDRGLRDLAARWPTGAGTPQATALFRRLLRLFELRSGRGSAAASVPAARSSRAGRASEAAAGALTAALSGRFAAAHEQVDAGLALVGQHDRTVPRRRDLLLLSRALAHAFAGDAAAAKAVVERELGHCLERGPAPGAVWLTTRAAQLLLAGQLGAAAGTAAAAVAATSERDDVGIRPLALAFQELIDVRTGARATAAGRCGGAPPPGPSDPALRVVHAQVTAWRAPDDQRQRVANELVAAADHASDRGHAVFGLLAAHDAALLAPGHPVAMRYLATATREVEGDLVRVLHDHASAPLDADAAVRIATLRRLEGCGFVLSALETAAQLAHAEQDRADAGAADRWTREVRGILSRWPGIARPRTATIADDAATPPRDGPADWCASLAARGWAPSDIAGELGMEVATVEHHLRTLGLDGIVPGTDASPR